jgi:hypothetical protein
MTVSSSGQMPGFKSHALHGFAMIESKILPAAMLKIGGQLRHECVELPGIVESCHYEIAPLMALGVVAVVIDHMATDGVVVGVYHSHDPNANAETGGAT